jgi:peptide/nickel transport system permease protein
MATTDPTTVLPGGAALAGSAGDVQGDGVQARGYWENAFRRLRKDRLAILSAVIIVLFIIIPFIGAPIAEGWAGHSPNDLISGGVDNFVPVGPFSSVSDGQGGTTYLVLGGSDLVCRDEFLRLLAGAQVSLEVGVLSTIVGLVLGLVLGLMAGFYGGIIDTIVSRLTEIVMAFPLLLFIIALASTVGDRLNNITLGFLGKGVLTLVLVLGFFGWYYPARIVRAQILSLREKEFIEAARMVGANDWRIIRSHLLPHLVAPIIVLSTITIAQFILAEAGLSFLGIGIQDPTPSWGKLLSVGPDYYLTQPWLMVWPGLAVLLATLAFNLLGDGLRDAFDPRSTR